MTLLKECVSWVRTPRGMLLVALLVCGGVLAVQVTGLTLTGVVPVVMGLACLLPCLIPLMLLRKTPQTPSAAQRGDDSFTPPI